MVGLRDLRWSDVLVPGALVLVGWVEMVATRPAGWGYAGALVTVAGGLLVLRRRHGLVATTLAAVVLLQMPWIGPQLDSAATPILFCTVCGYSLARWVADYRGLLGAAIILLTFWVDYHYVDERIHGIGDVVFVLTLILPPYILGRLTHKLAEQKAVLELNQELVKREAVHAERDRIARELHDVIAHSLSAMVVQTAAAQDLVRSDPDRAEAVLGDVAATGRRALSETGRLLHVIRDEADELGLAPTPGLDQLPSLIERFRASGLHVEAQVDPLPGLPGGIDVSAYRIVQEALTNALKYGADGTADLQVTRTARGLAIHATNQSGGSTGGGSGLGLLGIAERVALLGGSLSHGVTAEGRFELDAELPVTP